MRFDIRIETPEGLFFAMYMQRGETEVGIVGTDKVKKISEQVAHGRLGHMSSDESRHTMKLLGWELMRGYAKKPCESCAVGKAKQKNVTKLSDSLIDVPIQIPEVRESTDNPTEASDDESEDEADPKVAEGEEV